MAHAENVIVEAELGRLVGEEVTSESSALASPNEVRFLSLCRTVSVCPKRRAK